MRPPCALQPTTVGKSVPLVPACRIMQLSIYVSQFSAQDNLEQMPLIPSSCCPFSQTFQWSVSAGHQAVNSSTHILLRPTSIQHSTSLNCDNCQGGVALVWWSAPYGHIVHSTVQTTQKMIQTHLKAETRRRQENTEYKVESGHKVGAHQSTHPTDPKIRIFRQ